MGKRKTNYDEQNKKQYRRGGQEAETCLERLLSAVVMI